MNRNNFLKTGIIGLSGILSYPVSKAALFQNDIPGLNADKVKEFVIAGHGNLSRVKEMLLEEPRLINSSYDWGGGDFEEAIEGAGHVGNKELANYLIEQGARVNLFILTMLGKKDLVIPTLEEYPSLINSQGAHGFSLLHHAKKGGEESKEILDYLLDKGLTINNFNS